MPGAKKTKPARPKSPKKPKRLRKTDKIAAKPAVRPAKSRAPGPPPEDRFRTILDHAPLIVLEVDREGTILYANRTLSGAPVSEMIGRCAHDFLPENARALSRENSEKAFLSKTPVSYEVPDVLLGESHLTIRIHVSPIERKGDIRSASVIVEDITDPSRLRSEIAIRVEIEELLVSLAGDFIRVDPEGLDRAIESALRRVGETAGAETGGLFLFSEDRSRFFAPHVWIREGLDLARLGPAGLETASFPWSMRRILGNEPVLIESYEDLPPEAAPERAWLFRAQAPSFAGVPVATEGKVVGFVGFVYRAPQGMTSADLVLVVQTLSIIFTKAIERREAALLARRNERRYRDLVQQSLVGIGVFQGVPPRIVFANPAASEILGYEIEELAGGIVDLAAGLIHPEDRPAVIARYTRRLAGDTIPSHLDFRVLRKDGSIRWIEVFSTAITYLGEPAVQLMFVDRTGQREASAALQRSEELYRTLADSAQDYIFLLDSGMRLTFINPAGARFFGEEPARLLGRKLGDFMPPEIAEERERNTRRVFETGEPVHLVNKVPFRNGTLVLDTTLAPVRDAGGGVASVLGIARDITEQKRAEEERRRSDERYRLLAESAQDFIVIIGPDMRFRYVNRALAEFNRCTQESMIGKRSGDYMPEEVAAGRDRNLRLVLESGKAVRLTNEFRTNRGVIILDSSLIPLREEGCDISSVLVISRDVTEQIKARDALKRSEERYRLLAESAQDAIFVVGEDMRFQYANQACADYLDLQKEDVVGKTYRELVPHEVAVDRERDTRIVLEAGETRRFTSELLLKTGPFVIDTTLVPLPVSPGEPRSVLGIAHDITEQKRAEKIIHRYNERLEEEVRKRTEEIRILEQRQVEIDKLAAIGRMAGRIAHEINNPLAGIRNALVLIEKKIPPGQEYARYVPIMLREIDRIAFIISQMHDLHAGEEVTPARFLLGSCVEDVVTLLGPISEKKRVRLDLSLPDPRKIVFQPEDLFKQILYNLILNAIEASPPDGSVSVRAEVGTDGSSLLEVSDEGPGIPPEHRPRLYEPYFTTKEIEETGGLGLGLATVRSIVDALKGAVGFECPPGGGTTFRVRIPAGKEGSE